MFVVSVAFGSDGVNTEERVVNLPQDQDAWYISVVGEGESYQRLISWFNSDASLENLKSQVKFKPVDTNSAIYKTRYADNVSGLPTVRMQKADGTVVYEAAGDEIPYTSEALYGALADAANGTQGILRPWRHGAPPYLPWRKKMEKQCQPEPAPCPTPEPVDPPPFVTPFVPPAGPPDFVDESNVGLAIFLSILGLLVGAGVGLAQCLKKEYLPE
jgi:hypothetical protein